MRKLLLTIATLLSVHLAFAQNPCAVSFTHAASSSNPLDVTVTNTTNFTLIPGSTPNMMVFWGDGASDGIGYQVNSTATHTYANAGTFAIVVAAYYWDTLNNALYCVDSAVQSITITPPCASTVTSQNNGGGSFTFTANNVGGGTGVSYDWDFGDGNIGSGASVNHTYANSGVYIVTLTATSPGCTDVVTTQVAFSSTPLNCGTVSASMNITGAGMSRSFTNTSTQVPNFPIPVSIVATWDFGDGSPLVSGTNFTTHAYAAPGVYTAKIITQWIDSFNQITYCIDSSTQQITITPPANVIEGEILWDTTITNLQQASFKVWLILYDSAQNTLTPIDSSIVTGFLSAPYSFPGYAPGSYRVKAAVLNGTPGANQLVPTYHVNSPFWNTATVINHPGWSLGNLDIHMIPGSYSSTGPGFIGGNISAGANKGTNGGVPNILVLLRNSFGDVVRFTYTDANGNYSFGNLPGGTYDVYPEHMNYITIPSTGLNLVSGKYSATGIDFKHTPTHIMPIGTGIKSIADKMFSIFPNPSQGRVEIRWSADITGTATVHVADVAGRIVYNAAMEAGKSSTLELTHLQPGVYFVRVLTGQAQHTERIIIQR